MQGQLDAGDDFLIEDTARLTGNVVSNDDMTLRGDSVISGNLTTGDLISISANAVISGLLDAGGSVTLSNSSQVTGNIDSGRDIRINDDSVVQGDLVAGDDFIIEENGQLTGDVLANDDMTIRGDSVTSGNLTTGDTIHISSNAQVTGDLQSNGNISISNTSQLDGDATSNNGDIFLRNDVIVSGNLVIGDDFQIRNNAQLTGNVQLTDDAIIEDNSVVTGNISGANYIEVREDAEVNGDLQSTVDVSLRDRILLIGNIQAGDDVSVSGSSIMTGNITASDQITVNNSARINGDLTTPNYTRLRSNSVIDGNVYADTRLDLESNADITGECPPWNYPTCAGAANTRIINSATVDGNSSTSVIPGASITIELEVTTSYTGTYDDWRSTGWLIANSSGSLTCVNSRNFNSAGTHTDSFNVTVPSTPGTYNLYLVAYETDSCTGGESEEFILANAVEVQVYGQLVHSYDFDDDWPTTTSLTDSVGSANGTLIFAPVQIDALASGSKPDTCYAAEMNAGAFHLDGLNVDTGSGEIHSVAFWMYWDGTNSIMPFGWNIHDLWLNSGSFGFNSGNGDLYGISSSGLANSWHHVVAVFNNNNLTANKLYIDGVEQTLTQRRSSPNNSRAVVSTSASISGWRYSTGYRFNGKLDEVRIYQGQMGQSQIDAEIAYSKTCPPLPPPDPAELKHYYEFDDPWDISDILNDSEGDVDGTPTGSPSRVDAPSSGIKPNTCSAADISSDAFHLDSLDINTSAGQANSVSFWMYWDGTNNVMPFGWRNHDLWFNSGSFGFNSFNSDIYGISSSGLANGWHHVAAVFRNNALTTNKLYIDGVEQTLTQRTGSPNNTNATADTSASISGVRRSSSYRFSGMLDEVKIYTGTINQDQVNADMAAKSCDNNLLAYFELDEFILDGTPGEFFDNIGTSTSARAIGADIDRVEPTENGKVCYGVDIPANNNGNVYEAIDTGIDVDTAIGNSGSISFWYNNNEDWTTSGNTARVLFDASSDDSDDKYFHLTILNNGRLQLAMEDDRDTNLTLSTASGFSFAAGTWTHITATWDIDADQYKIFVNGNEQTLSGSMMRLDPNIGNLRSLYFGDNRNGGYVVSTSRNSANGRFDEIRIYNGVISKSQVVADMNSSHPCDPPPAVDHYVISYPLGNPGLTCEANAIQIDAFDADDNLVAPLANTEITLTTSVGSPEWSLNTGDGTFTSPNRYAFDGVETGVNLWLRHATEALFDIDVNDGIATDDDTEDPASFEDAGLRFYVKNTTDSIGNQISGKPSSSAPGNQSLVLRAVQKDEVTQACEAALEGDAVVSFAYECNNPSTCLGSDKLLISRQETFNASGLVSIDPITTGYTNVTLRFDENGIAPFSFKYNDAGQITLHASTNISARDGLDPPSTEVTVIGTSDPFVVIPYQFHLSNLQTADSAADQDVQAKAGDDFATTLTAKMWPDLDNNGVIDATPDFSLASLTTSNFGRETNLQTIGISHEKADLPEMDAVSQAGILAGDTSITAGLSAGNFLNGSTDINLNYNEVGIIDLIVILTDYLATGVDISTEIEKVGRFIPYQFQLVGTLGVEPSHGSFSYMSDDPLTGNPLIINFTLQAQNKDGLQTSNFTGDFTNNASVSLLIENNNDGNGTNLMTRLLDSGLDSVDWNQGNYIVDNSILFSLERANTPDYLTSLAVGVAVSYDEAGTDNDLALGNANMNPDTDTDCTATLPNPTCNYTQIGSSTVELRYGRLALPVTQIDADVDVNATIPIQAEYFNGIDFVTNTEDTGASATDLGAAWSSYFILSNNFDPDSPDTGSIDVQTGATSNAALSSQTLSNGATSFVMTDPGEVGYVDVSFDVWNLFDYFAYDWNGDGVTDQNDNPKAKVTFGKKTDSTVIYRRNGR